jgi:hypothetical protein
MSSRRGRNGKLVRPLFKTPYITFWCELLASPAYQVLTLSARRVFDRIVIEHLNHAGTRNGRLIVTYDDFQESGIGRHETGPALRELEALGLIRFTRRGRGGNREFRISHMFQLTHWCVPILEMDEKGRSTDKIASWREPTDEWSQIKTLDEAKTKQKVARQLAGRSRRRTTQQQEAA